MGVGSWEWGVGSWEWEVGSGEWEVWSVQLIKVYEGLYRFIIVTSNSTFVVRCSTFVVHFFLFNHKGHKGGTRGTRAVKSQCSGLLIPFQHSLFVVHSSLLHLYV